MNAIGDEPQLNGRSIDLTVIEGNSGANMATGIVLDQFSKAAGGNYVVRKNDFDRGTATLAGSHGVFVGSGVVPALRDNAWRNFEVPYLGLATLPVLEFPTRTVGLRATAGGAAVTGVLPLWNSGTSTLAWSVTSDAAWLGVAPPTGATGPDNGVTALTLTANPAGLAPGTYTATVRATTAFRGAASSAQVPTDPNASDGQPLELGTRVRVTQSGVATALRFFKATGETGTHQGRLWTATGQLLATVTFTGETVSGWQTAPSAAP